MGDDPGRRTVLFGGAAVAVGMGGLNPRPLNAPPAGQPGVGVQPGSTPGIFRFLIVFGPGPSSGVFVYKVGTTPGLGNPPVESMGESLVDPFGNAIQPGVVSYLAANPHVFAQLFQGILTLSTNLGAATDQWTLNASLVSGTAWLAIVNTGTPGVLFIAPGGVVTAPNPASLGTPEPWHAPTTTGFGTVAGAQPVEYRINATGNVEITGAMAASGAYTAGTTIWTMPVGYRPTTNIASVSVDIDTGGAFTSCIAQVTSAGLVSIPINVAAAAEVFFSGGSYRLPL